jgi:DNA-binding transcriptional LysR family regulator
MRPIDPADLSGFLAIARHRSFRKAAAELGVTASALSHALRNLEERLNLRLVNRTTRSVALTEAGERLHNRVRPAFLDINDAIEDLNAFRGAPAGTLRINSALKAARLALLPIVTRFMQRYPDIKVEIVANDALVDIVAAGFDAGIRFRETVAADMIAVPIGPRQRFAVVGSPAYFKRHATPTHPQNLNALPCIRYRHLDGTIFRWEFARGGAVIDIDVDGPLTLTEQGLMVEAAMSGTGLAYVFEGMVERPLAERKLARALTDWCPLQPSFSLYFPSRRHLPAALRAFVDFVKSPAGRSAK